MEKQIYSAPVAQFIGVNATALMQSSDIDVKGQTITGGSDFTPAAKEGDDFDFAE